MDEICKCKVNFFQTSYNFVRYFKSNRLKLLHESRDRCYCKNSVIKAVVLTKNVYESNIDPTVAR